MLNCFGPVRSGENIIGSVRGRGHKIYYFSVRSGSGQKITGQCGVGVPKTLPRRTLTTCDIDMSWSYDSTSVGVYGVFSDFRSKVIKGSFPVQIQKSSKCIFFYKQHVISTWVSYMTRHQSVSMGSSRIWGQRSFRGHFRSESKNL